MEKMVKNPCSRERRVIVRYSKLNFEMNRTQGSASVSDKR